jgi:enamine deaminase RidA (YjgF/YER057c/UK114 family)
VTSRHRSHSRSGSPFEAQAAYSRAVRVGDAIAVSGTAATGADGAALSPSTYEQARECFRRALAAVDELGGGREDVTRTRMYLTLEADWREAVRAHAEIFAGVDPANTTLYVAGFIPTGVVIEVELDAITAPSGD